MKKNYFGPRYLKYFLAPWIIFYTVLWFERRNSDECLLKALLVPPICQIPWSKIFEYEILFDAACITKPSFWRVRSWTRFNCPSLNKRNISFLYRPNVVSQSCSMSVFNMSRIKIMTIPSLVKRVFSNSNILLGLNFGCLKLYFTFMVFSKLTDFSSRNFINA